MVSDTSPKSASPHLLTGRHGRRLAADADVDDSLGLADAVEGAGHEGVVVGERWRRRRASRSRSGWRAPVSLMIWPMRTTASMLMPPLVVATLTSADTVGTRQRFRNGGDEGVADGAALVHEGGEAADEVDVKLFRRSVERLRDADCTIDGLALGGACQRRVQQVPDGRHCDTLVDDGDAELLLYGLSLGDQVLRTRGNGIVDVVPHRVDVRRNAAPEIDAHGHRTDVEVLGLDHADGLEDFLDRVHAHPFTPCACT